MTKEEFLTMVESFEKADWIRFEQARGSAFALTQADIDAIKETERQEVEAILATYQIDFSLPLPTTKTEWKTKLVEYVSAVDLKALVGDDLQEYVTAEINDCGDNYFEKFCKIVKQFG